MNRGSHPSTTGTAPNPSRTISTRGGWRTMAERGTGDRPEYLTPVPDPETVPDAGSLLAAVARGEEKAFGRLYDLVAPRVYGLARRVLRDPAQAEEVAQ